MTRPLAPSMKDAHWDGNRHGNATASPLKPFFSELETTCPRLLHPSPRAAGLLCLTRHTFPAFRLQPRCVPRHRFTRHNQRAGRISDFAMNEQARRHTPPNRVRYPADCQFTSSCSPPRLAATQLLSATGSWLTLTRTSTVQISRLRRRTVSRAGGYPENPRFPHARE